MIDVIVPTIAGRQASLERCLDSYRDHTHPDALNLIVIHDQPTCGKAWIKGLKHSTAPYVHLTCDDIEVTSPTWAAVCIEAVDRGQLPCPIIRRPDGGIESCGGDMNATHCLIAHEQPDGTEVDFTPLPFMSREQVQKIGMIGSHYLSDTYVSYKARQFGWPTVVTHGYAVTHHHESVGRRTVTAEDHVLFREAL